jgi:hypothetical protein
VKGKLALILAIATAALVVAIPFDASGSTPGQEISCLQYAVRSSTASTSSTSWTNVPGLVVTATLAQNFEVQVSGTFTGAPAKFRLMDTTTGGTFALAPGPTNATFIPGTFQGFSFTWVGTNPAEHSHKFVLQWARGGTGGTLQMRTGALTVVFLGAPTPTTC